MTSPSVEEALSVVQARTLLALTVANRVLEFADPTSPVANDPHGWAKVGGELKYLELEVLHTAVMRMSGVSWEALASGQDVPKQSLHRRLSKKIEKETELAKQEHLDERIEMAVNDLIKTVSKLRGDIATDSVTAANQVVARSKLYRWWDSAMRR